MGGRGHIYKMNVDSIPIDTMRFFIRQDSSRVNFRLLVQNNKRNPQLVFKSIVNGYIDGNRVGADAQFYDKHNVKGLDMGVMAEMLDSGINVHLAPYEPLIGYKTFRLNTDNYLAVGSGKEHLRGRRHDGGDTVRQDRHCDEGGAGTVRL